MKTLGYVIVETDTDYNNKIELNNKEIILTTSKENVEYINRIVTVVDSPKGTVLEKGDEIVIHHNILRTRKNMKGENIKSNYHYTDNKYIVPLREIFMYRKNKEEWKALAPYCFIKPIKKEDEKIGNIIIQTSDQNSYKGSIKNEGIAYYIPDELIKQGVNKGDRVVFQKDSEYEFIIDNVTYYKMSISDVLGVIK